MKLMVAPANSRYIDGRTSEGEEREKEREEGDKREKQVNRGGRDNGR